MTEERTPQDQPLDYAAPLNAPMSKMAIASMVLGIIATPLDYAFELGLLVGLLACILGAVSIARINRRGLGGKPFAIAGIILGCVALLVGITCGVMLFRSI
jgi:hypothetical protein